MSWRPDPDTFGIDSFTLQWDKEPHCNIFLSSFQSDPTGYQQADEGQGQSSSDYSFLATCLLVPTDADIAGGRTACTPQAKFRPTTALLGQAPSPTQETASPGCATIEKALEAQGF